MYFNKLLLVICLGLLLSSCNNSSTAIPYHKGQITIDGTDQDSVWLLCDVYEDFVSPWKKQSVPTTRFKTFYDDEYLYVHFTAKDKDQVCNTHKLHKRAVEQSDRVEVFFSKDEEMSQYYGMEFDICGRMISFKSTGYRNFKKNWKFPHFKRKDYRTRKLLNVYQSEIRIPLKALEELELINDNKLWMGVFRANYNSQSYNKVQWISWKMLNTQKPDFHNIKGFKLMEFGDKP